MTALTGKRVLVGITGGIAAYKTCELVRLLRAQGAQVTCAMTAGAQKFIAPLTFAALSGRAVLTEVWQMSAAGGVEHVEVGHETDLIIIAPATADHVARLHAGFADDALGALVLASTCPVLIAPAMETNMWQAATTQRNVAALAAMPRFSFIGPASGALASGHTGEGRMSEPAEIAARAEKLLTPQDLAGLRVVVSAGPTREAIDPVRYISNRSSGKMGFALAAAAARRGAAVTLVHGPVALTPPAEVTACPVQTAAEMLAALEDAVSGCDVLLMCAAVADFAAREVAPQKLKRAALGPEATIALKQNPDVLARLKPLKKNATYVAFAAETENLAAHAAAKLKAKGADLIVANDVADRRIGFDSDENAVTIFDVNGLRREIAAAPKREVAHAILDEVLRFRA